MAQDLTSAGGPARRAPATARRLPDRVTPFGVPGTPGEPLLRWSSSATTVEGISRELTRIWALPQAIAAATDAPERSVAARTSVLNLVVVCDTAEAGADAAATIVMLTGRHPSRTIVLVPTDPDGPDSLTANVKAYCMMPRPDAVETCAELIEVHAGGDTGRHLASIVAPLLVHDLPVTVWWPGDPPFGTRLADDLLAMADRLVVDGSRWTGDGLDRLRYVARTAGPHLAVSDFALMRQARWREAVASVFDVPEFTPYVRHVRRIAVTYGTPGGPDTEAATNVVKPIDQVAWLASRLDLVVERPLVRAERARSGPRRAPAPGAAPDPGRGLRASLGAPRGGDVEVVIRPVVSTMSAGTTLRVELLAERRGTELRAEVTAEDETVRVRVWEDGVEALDRVFLAPRATDIDLLAEAIEAGGRDAVAEGALRAVAALTGYDAAVNATGGASSTGTIPGDGPPDEIAASQAAAAIDGSA
jgi:glucose-6-phosphate dehydrogenase assembly protein OpcA